MDLCLSTCIYTNRGAVSGMRISIKHLEGLYTLAKWETFFSQLFGSIQLPSSGNNDMHMYRLYNEDEGLSNIHD